MNDTDRSCRNCGSKEMYYTEVLAPTLPIGTMFSLAALQLWVCGTCGLTMSFVPQEFLGKVKEKFHRYDPGG